MFTLGIILLAVGLVLRMVLKMAERRDVRYMSPLPMSQRTYNLRNLKRQRRAGFIDSNLMILVGALLILHTAVFN